MFSNWAPYRWIAAVDPTDLTNVWHLAVSASHLYMSAQSEVLHWNPSTYLDSILCECLQDVGISALHIRKCHRENLQTVIDGEVTKQLDAAASKPWTSEPELLSLGCSWEVCLCWCTILAMGIIATLNVHRASRQRGDWRKR